MSTFWTFEINCLLYHIHIIKCSRTKYCYVPYKFTVVSIPLRTLTIYFRSCHIFRNVILIFVSIYRQTNIDDTAIYRWYFIWITSYTTNIRNTYNMHIVDLSTFISYMLIYSQQQQSLIYNNASSFCIAIYSTAWCKFDLFDPILRSFWSFACKFYIHVRIKSLFSHLYRKKR